MNYVLLAFIAAPGYVLAAVLAFILYSQGRDREVVEARLYTERDDALLQCEKLKPERDDALKLYAMLSREHAELVAHNADLQDALTDAQREIKALHMQRGTVPVKLRRTSKKAGSE